MKSVGQLQEKLTSTKVKKRKQKQIAVHTSKAVIYIVDGSSLVAINNCKIYILIVVSVCC